MPANAPAGPIGDVAESLHTGLELLADPAFWGRVGQRAVLVVLVLVATWVVLRVARKLMDELAEARGLPEAAVYPVRRVFRWGVWVVALLLVLQFLGVPMATLWAAVSAVVALVAVGFVAVWSVLSNIACSLMLLIFKPFAIGDEIEFVDNPAGPNVGGRVVDVTLMYVTLACPGGSFVQVPNNLFFQKPTRRTPGRAATSLAEHVEQNGLTGVDEPPAQP